MNAGISLSVSLMGNETQQPSLLSGGQMRDYQLQVCTKPSVQAYALQ